MIFSHSFLLRKTMSKFVIVVIYVNDLNLIGTLQELTKTATYLKDEFDMKDLEKTKKFLVYRLNIS